MNPIRKHIVRCVLAGIVALLPILGLVILVVQLETWIANSGLRTYGLYTFGMGILASILFVYGVGLVTTTLIGKWIWQRIDRLIDHLPLLGELYRSVKQILGYGDGPDALFKRVVYVRLTIDSSIEELGLVTSEVKTDQQDDRLIVFLPNAPAPTSGRILFVPTTRVRPSELTVSQALRMYVSLGSTGHDRD